MTNLEYLFSTLTSAYPSLQWRVEKKYSQYSQAPKGDILWVRKGVEYEWVRAGSSDLDRWPIGQFTSHITNLLGLDNNEGRSFLATSDKKEVREAGYRLGGAFGRSFMTTFDTEAFQILALWFAQNSGYPDMDKGFEFMLGFVQGLVDGPTAGKVTPQIKEGKKKTDNIEVEG